MIYVGLDRHRRYITACALDAEGALLAASRRLPADWPALGAWLAVLPSPRTVVLESCLYCWWLERQLTANGDTELVVEPHQVKLISQARAKTNPIDAFKLADLARARVLPALWVPVASARELIGFLSGPPRATCRRPPNGLGRMVCGGEARCASTLRDVMWPRDAVRSGDPRAWNEPAPDASHSCRAAGLGWLSAYSSRIHRRCCFPPSPSHFPPFISLLTPAPSSQRPVVLWPIK